MNIPPGTTILHTAIAAFTLGVAGGSPTTFQATQSGGPQTPSDVVETGYLTYAGDAVCHENVEDSATCN